MPRPQGPIKQSGDIHLPEVESDFDLAGNRDMAASARDESSMGSIRRSQLVQADGSPMPAMDDELEPGYLAGEQQSLHRPMQKMRSLPLKQIGLGLLGFLVLRRLLSRSH